jgi:hypothetical protein
MFSRNGGDLSRAGRTAMSHAGEQLVPVPAPQEEEQERITIQLVSH